MESVEAKVLSAPRMRVACLIPSVEKRRPTSSGVIHAFIVLTFDLDRDIIVFNARNRFVLRRCLDRIVLVTNVD